MTFDRQQRDRLAWIADGLIPGTDEMPAPSSIDIGGRQLDVVLGSRPDLAEDLRRALEVPDSGDAVAWLDLLDGKARDALVTVVIAGYYLHRDVQRRLGYPGQIGDVVKVDSYPVYAHEGQLERVLDRGPIYRPTPLP